MLKLRYNSEKIVYIAGEEIRGVCIVRLADLMEPNANQSCFAPLWSSPQVHLRINLVGSGNAHWKTTVFQKSTSNNRSSNQEITYEANRRYLDLEKKFKLSSTELNRELAIPFTFQLPRNLVPSFNHQNVSVRYWLEATVENLPGNVVPPKDFANIEVLQRFDPNLPENNVNLEKSEKAITGCLCCKAGPFHIQARLERTAFPSGGVISLSGRLENQDSRSSALISVKLCQSLRLYAQGQTKDSSQSWELFSVSPRNGLGILGSGQIRYLDNVEFHLPRTLPPSITNGEIFEVRYTIQVGLTVNWSGSMAVTLPIVLGGQVSQTVVNQPMAPSAPPLELPPSYDTIFGSNESIQSTSKKSRGWRSWFRSSSSGYKKTT